MSKYYRLCYSLSSVLISRFLLDLQAARKASAHVSSSCDVGTIVFQQVFGSIASSIPAQYFTTGEREDESCDDGETVYCTPTLERVPVGEVIA